MGEQELDAIRKQRLAQMESQFVSQFGTTFWVQIDLKKHVNRQV